MKSEKKVLGLGLWVNQSQRGGWKQLLLHPSLLITWEPKGPNELRALVHPRQSPESRALGPFIPPHEAFTVYHVDPLSHQAETPPKGPNRDRSETSRGPFLLAWPAGYHDVVVSPCLVSPA